MGEFYRWDGKGRLSLFCQLSARASKDEFVGQHGERLKIRITAPPVDGKANAHLIKFIAKQFAVSRASVSIHSGDSSKHKTLHIEQPGCLPEGLGISPNPQSS